MNLSASSNIDLCRLKRDMKLRLKVPSDRRRAEAVMLE
jgi:hypothetical protein